MNFDQYFKLQTHLGQPLPKKSCKNFAQSTILPSLFMLLMNLRINLGLTKNFTQILNFSDKTAPLCLLVSLFLLIACYFHFAYHFVQRMIMITTMTTITASMTIIQRNSIRRKRQHNRSRISQQNKHCMRIRRILLPQLKS